MIGAKIVYPLSGRQLMRILYSSLNFVGALGLLFLIGCASAPKQAESTNSPSLTYWEYKKFPISTKITATDLNRDPQFVRLKLEGWMFMGVNVYPAPTSVVGTNLSTFQKVSFYSYPDTTVEGNRVYIESPAGAYLVFRRECKPDTQPPL
jgi:hypothetical protein